jgi:putative transcriptional regulator
MSQEALAAKCGLDRTYVSGIERGTRNPSLTNILKIADSLAVSASELFAAAQDRLDALGGDDDVAAAPSPGRDARLTVSQKNGPRGGHRSQRRETSSR